MNCIIIEDELPAQRILQNYISKLPDLTIEGCFQSALNANTLISNQNIDVVFLDINLPDISGIQYIKTLANPPAVIMTTAYHEHAVESFELDTICDYLVKPFSFERFLKAVNKAKKNHQKKAHNIINVETSTEHVFLNIDKTLHKINFSDIIYIESDKNYVTVVTDHAKWSYIESLKNWILKLPADDFIQVHKSFIVSYNRIEKINGNQLIMKDNKIPIGRSFKTSLLRKVNGNDLG
ncbi:LytR/AlgR family response regulator transcription factor [Maribacter sp. HTCC2170]|uniref:LytR/AlgR family response regulator transcription factor n=1 Tax=Maribacter sp. (strain HTCC2170 / KCCM 42371) TaxID=313603 RepID=UPI00006BD47B|nr:LytTR family DNA-binding domain-containing protein [Maribacter sp. HTCC2170]EAR02704.1 two-component system response regulator protein [Maribacter sp. HTCC2170]